MDCCSRVADTVGRRHIASQHFNYLTVRRYRLSNFGRLAFFVAGPATWNSLPDNLCDTALCSDSFRRLFTSRTCLLCLVFIEDAGDTLFERAMRETSYSGFDLSGRLRGLTPPLVEDDPHIGD